MKRILTALVVSITALTGAQAQNATRVIPLQNGAPISSTNPLYTTSSGGGGGLSVIDGAAFSAGNGTTGSSFTPSGGEYNSSPTALTSGKQGTLALNQYRAAFVDIMTTNSNFYTAITSPIPCASETAYNTNGGYSTGTTNPVACDLNAAPFVHLVPGTSLAGKFGIDQTTTGTTNNVTVSPLPAAARNFPGCTVAATTTACLSASTATVFLQIQNVSSSSTDYISCAFGVSAVLNAKTAVLLAPGQAASWGPNTGGVPTGALNCIATAGSTPLYVEWL